MTELTEEPVEELEEDAASAAKAEESTPAEETAAPAEKAEEPAAPVEKAEPAACSPQRKRPSLLQKRLPHRKLPRLLLRPSRWRKTLVRMMFCRRTDYLLDAPAPAVA